MDRLRKRRLPNLSVMEILLVSPRDLLLEIAFLLLFSAPPEIWTPNLTHIIGPDLAGGNLIPSEALEHEEPGFKVDLTKR